MSVISYSGLNVDKCKCKTRLLSFKKKTQISSVYWNKTREIRRQFLQSYFSFSAFKSYKRAETGVLWVFLSDNNGLNIYQHNTIIQPTTNSNEQQTVILYSSVLNLKRHNFGMEHMVTVCQSDNSTWFHL